MTKPGQALLRALTSLKLTIVLLALLMVLVVACTLAQVHLGTYDAVATYIRSWFVYWTPPGMPFRLPVFPGGGLVGCLLLANLAAAQFMRLERSWRKAGIWVIHVGLVMLFLGEFITGFFQAEMRMVLKEGGPAVSHAEDYHAVELALIDKSAPDRDVVYAVPEAWLARRALITDARLPLSARVKGFSPASEAEGGRPARAEVTLESRDGKSWGPWELDSQGEGREIEAEGRTFAVFLRPARRYFPFSLALKDFTHERHPGTDVPKVFASLLRLKNPAREEDREVMISMNEPLRYSGLSFYQASFGEDDTVSVLQVVANPGRLMPYLACALVTLGLLVHFLGRLRRPA